MIHVIIHVFIDGRMVIVIVMKIMYTNLTVAIGDNAILGREGDQSIWVMANGSIVVIGCGGSSCCL